MVLITSDGGRDLADNQIPMGDTETGLVEEGGEMGAYVPVLLPLGPYETPEKLHGSQAPSTLGSAHVLGLREFPACLSGHLTRQVFLFLVKKCHFAWQSPEVAPSRCSRGLLGSVSSIPHCCCSSIRGTRLGLILTWLVSVCGCGLSSPSPLRAHPICYRLHQDVCSRGQQRLITGIHV